MILTADYHTHTTFSHGKGSILDNALSASEKGLKQIAITDHGYGHRAYGIKHKKVPYMKELCIDATIKTGVEVLFGVESNILGLSGKTDMRESDMRYMDVYLAGVHKFITYEKLKEWYLLLYKNWRYKKSENPPNELIKRNTEVYINAIKNNPIDVLAHPGYCCFINAYDVASCCADYGTYFEIDARKTHLLDSEWEEVLKTSVKFVVDSDAHAPQNVGVIGSAEELIKRVGIPLDRIENIQGRLPNFSRFSEYKQKKI